MKNFLVKYKKAIINGLLTLLIFVGISVIAMLILWACGVIYFDDGMQFNIHIFDAIKSSWLVAVIFIVLQMICTTVLCFLPGTTMMFIVLGQTLYPDPVVAFAIVFTGVVISSIAMYLTGRFGGYKICVKMLGEEDCARATTLLRDKGTVFFPIMMLFPMFPDDALVMVSGTLKMKLGWFFPSIIVGRGIGIATIIFGLSIIPYDKFTSPLHWILFIGGCIAFIVAIFYLAHMLNKYLDKHSKKKQAEDK